MAYFLFVDESGTDGRSSPYEVLAGLAVEESRLWPLITDVHNAEIAFFGQRLTNDGLELKATNLLKRKVFRHAAQLPPFPHQERSELAHAALREGANARMASRTSRHTRAELTALAQAKLAFVEKVLGLCADHDCSTFASMVIRGAPRLANHRYLRKDYAFLFERFFNLLENRSRFWQRDQNGFVVLDELDDSLNAKLVSVMHEYFRDTRTGRQRAHRIVPEPFIVRSDFTTLVQVADLIAYALAWGFEYGSTTCARAEIRPFCQRIEAIGLRTNGLRGRWRGRPVFPFYVIHDLMPPATPNGGRASAEAPPPP